MTWVLKSVLQTLETAFRFDKMNNSQQRPLFGLVFTQLPYYFQRAFPGPAVCLGTQYAPSKGKEGQTFPRKIHSGLGTHVPGSQELFYIFVLPHEPSETSSLSRNKKSPFSKTGGNHPKLGITLLSITDQGPGRSLCLSWTEQTKLQVRAQMQQHSLMRLFLAAV